LVGKPTYEELEIKIQKFERKIETLQSEIKKHRHPKESFEKKEEKFREIIESSLNWIYEMNAEGVYTYASPQVKDLLGYEPKEILGKTLFDILAPQEIQRVSQVFNSLLQNPRSINNFVKKCLHKDGHEVVIESNGKPIIDDNGRLKGFRGIKWDITRRKQTEEALQESERRFRKIIEDISGISVQGYDEERKVIFWNQASENLYGYSKEEAIGEKLEDLIIPTSMREEVKRRHELWINQGVKISSEELILHDKFGNNVPVFCSHVMYETQSKKEMFCVDIDMTPIKNAEKERKQLESQLRQSQKMEAIGTLTGGIAHDFNNILAVIKGFAELMLLDKTEDDPDYFNLQEIDKAANRAKELISQLLLFSRKADTIKKPVNINQTIKQIERLLEKTIPKMINVETHLSEKIKNTFVDPVQIEQVILNLGSNAADSMPDGGRLTIKTSNTAIDEKFVQNNIGSVPGNYVLLEVIDTGCGIDKKNIKKIFDPFFTTKQIGKGTGLGLASVYGIVKGHGGYVTCESELNKGTVFKLYFPVLASKGDFVQETKSKPQLGTETILIVDDEKPVRTFLSHALKKFGYTSIEANDGEQALELYKKRSDGIDLILLDINMPGMSGTKCFEKLQKLNQDVKIIIVSGYAADSHFEDICSKASGYLKKPCDLNGTLKKIRRVLD